MGYLKQGTWNQGQFTSREFKTKDTLFRNWITVNGEAGPNGENGFIAEKGRYHLYVSMACPWAHRTLIFRSLMGLEDYIDVTVVNPVMLENGWEFNDEPNYDFKYLYHLYLKACPSYEGRVSVPVLWDKKLKTIVSNESSEIIRMFNSSFSHLTGSEEDFYPKELREKIDQINDHIFSTINVGVYKAGFSTSQEVYEDAIESLFSSLDWLEELLSQQRYLLGDTLTEADWRLFTTLIRFDTVYHTHFKCNIRKISEYPVLSDYLKELYQYPKIKETINFDHIKTHYYKSHKEINPSGLVPVGPKLDLDTPHTRDAL